MSKRRSTKEVWRRFTLREVACIQTAFLLADMGAPKGGFTKDAVWDRLKKEIQRDCDRRLDEDRELFSLKLRRPGKNQVD